jgi:hypothetical protein
MRTTGGAGENSWLVPPSFALKLKLKLKLEGVMIMAKRKTIEDMLKSACRNDYGCIDVTPGTDIAWRLAHLTDHARREMVKRGYLRQVGSGLVLTPMGYDVI